MGLDETQIELLSRALLDISKLREELTELRKRVDSLCDSMSVPPSQSYIHIGARLYLKKSLPDQYPPIAIGTWGAILDIYQDGEEGPLILGVLFAGTDALVEFKQDVWVEYLEFAYETYNDLREYVYSDPEQLRKDKEAGKFVCLERRGIINPG